MSEEEVVESTEEVVEEVAEETPVEESSSFVDSMLSQIDNDDIKSAGFWKNLEGKDANEVGKYIKELQSFAGKKGDIPKSDATDEEWSAFYQKLGRPENIEGYDFTIGDEFRELVGEDSIPYFEKTIDKIKEQAFQMGASSDQAENMVNIFLESVADSVEENNTENKQMFEEMEKELRTEWGEEYDGMMNGIESMLSANGFRDQLAEVNMDIAEMVRAGTKVPPHIAQKRLDLMNKLGDNL